MPMREARLPEFGSGPRRVTLVEKELIVDRLARICKSSQYNTERDKLCSELGLSPGQIGTIVTHHLKKQRAQGVQQ